MLNHRIRDLLFHYTKRCYFASILFGKSVSKKMHHLSFRALANDVNGTESQPNVLYLIVYSYFEKGCRKKCTRQS